MQWPLRLLAATRCGVHQPICQYTAWEHSFRPVHMYWEHCTGILHYTHMRRLCHHSLAKEYACHLLTLVCIQPLLAMLEYRIDHNDSHPQRPLCHRFSATLCVQYLCIDVLHSLWSLCACHLPHPPVYTRFLLAKQGYSSGHFHRLHMLRPFHHSAAVQCSQSLQQLVCNHAPHLATVLASRIVCGYCYRKLWLCHHPSEKPCD